MPNPNLELLTAAARLLKPLVDELVFVGGCTTGLLITEEAIADVRPTVDVDTISAVTSYADYVNLSDRLLALGFKRDTSEGAPLCRWLHSGIKVDVMPLDEGVLGFSNRWYESAIATAEMYEIAEDLWIRVVNAPYFYATKLEAFKGRGAGDFVASHDLEDLITVVDGRPQLLDELQAAHADVRAYIARETTTLLDSRQFLDALPGFLLPDAASQARVAGIMKTLNQIAAL
jgi:predicted nucleotidyltransferase